MCRDHLRAPEAIWRHPLEERFQV